MRIVQHPLLDRSCLTVKIPKQVRSCIRLTPAQRTVPVGNKRRKLDVRVLAVDGVDLPAVPAISITEITDELRSFVDDVCDLDEVETDKLLRAAILIAKHKYPGLDEAAVYAELDRLAALVQAELSKCEGPQYPMKICKTVSKVLYEQEGFTGAVGSYYNPDNSCINKVLELKVGIPISLSLVYMVVAQRCGLEMLGVNLPGHFMLKPKDDDVQILVDAFNGGEVCFLEDAEKKVQLLYGNNNLRLDGSFVQRKQQVPWRAFLGRWLNNLKHVYIQLQQPEQTLTIIRLLRVIRPDSVQEIRDEGLYLAQTHAYREAIACLELYLKLLPNAEDADACREILRLAQGALLNKTLKQQSLDG